MIKLLIVDDEIKIREVIKEYALVSGFECDEAEDGVEAVEKIKTGNYDVVILDIMMPNLDGYTACRQIKEIKDIPVIMLSARQEEFDKLLGFELGIDDYVTKPFSPRELIARVKVAVERSKGKKHSVYRFDTLEIDITGRNLIIDEERVTVTPKEFDLLVYLVQHKNQALSRDVLLDKVWNYNYFGDYRTVDTHIKMLRQNLGPYRDYIVTVRGTGYKFEADN
ncbi:response regulator transcription factor [Erysipelothrix inopinata]|uniref:Response regulator transcription factor n=1 Tax=Erysipelothrix inopinata TaxID=225084 RepID=A0A7G9RXQ6_9FIRM|nr:response regulator transcription factor [Erysipelothrix inopinata]QNN60381.1 response regulator transcription factor [Erysipelothrix inopinata]